MVTSEHESTRELLARIEAEDRAAEAAAQREHEDALRGEIAKLNAQIAKLTEPPPIRRSTLNAKQKSEIIRARGLAEYERLPW